MRILKFVVEGYRSLKSMEWRPGDLNVVRGAGASELQSALRLYARLSQGWSAFSDAMADERAGASPLWHPGADEVRMFALCAPDPDSALGLVIGYERITLSNDFEVTDVLERVGDRIEYTPARKKAPGTGILQRPKPEVLHIAGDMSSFNALPTFRKDARVAGHADTIALWGLHGALAMGEGTPVRAPSVPFGFHGRLAEDGRNLLNLLLDIYDWRDPRRALDGRLRDAILGYDGLRFPKKPDGSLGMELRTRDGARTPHHELPEETLRILATYGALLSPEPPSLLWIDLPASSLASWAVPPVAELALEAARRTRVVVSNPSPELARRLAEVTRSPGTTARKTRLSVAGFEVPLPVAPPAGA